MYEVQAGDVTYGDLNIDRVDITTTASGTRQDIRGFESSLRENIVCGLDELPMGMPSNQQLLAVAKLTGLIGSKEAEQSLPEGLDTKVRCSVAASLHLVHGGVPSEGCRPWPLICFVLVLDTQHPQRTQQPPPGMDGRRGFHRSPPACSNGR